MVSGRQLTAHKRQLTDHKRQLGTREGKLGAREGQLGAREGKLGASPVLRLPQRRRFQAVKPADSASAADRNQTSARVRE